MLLSRAKCSIHCQEHKLQIPTSELLSSAGSGVFDVSAGSSHMLASILEECLDKFPEKVEHLGELKPRLDFWHKLRCASCLVPGVS